MQTAVYIRSDLEYTSLTTSPLTNVTGDVYTSGAEVKINEQITLHFISVYLPNGPNGDNTDWLNNIALSNKKWVILGDFNAHAPFLENGCATVNCNRIIDAIVDSLFFLLNDGRITRILGVSTLYT